MLPTGNAVFLDERCDLDRQVVLAVDIALRQLGCEMLATWELPRCTQIVVSDERARRAAATVAAMSNASSFSAASHGTALGGDNSSRSSSGIAIAAAAASTAAATMPSAQAVAASLQRGFATSKQARRLEAILATSTHTSNGSNGSNGMNNNNNNNSNGVRHISNGATRE